LLLAVLVILLGYSDPLTHFLPLSLLTFVPCCPVFCLDILIHPLIFLTFLSYYFALCRPGFYFDLIFFILI
jgi:hypothetical protein